ncbi:jerky protein homolog-like isoform X1 [Mercenaria mercenaria]|uniref:jerky protein homolog-like isoform X1 n=1 Tax=Mercenaria mercenaria TaxID=6596 RepID=UPI00234FAFE0|nr:jerky protein homolog-like isoform X1 [Mercenaria mercenaria]
MTRKMVRCYIQEMYKASGRTSLFNLDKGPSDKWFRKPKKDYPQLAFRKPQSQDRERGRMSNKKVAGEFFQFWRDILENNSLLDKPSQIFNCDETGRSGKESGRGKVLGPRTGFLCQQKSIAADHMTAHLCVSVDGRFMPTMIIFKGSLPHRNYKDGLPGSWLFSTSESGYMDSELFYQWFIRIFLPNCGRARPVVLLMDNHDSHISLPLVEKAREEHVLLVGLPSHTTHYLQPLDVHITGPVKEKVTSLASSVF